MAACREYLPHTDPFGSVQHCPTGSTQPSLPDHLAAIAITRPAFDVRGRTGELVHELVR